jgi:hypothetical protein
VGANPIPTTASFLRRPLFVAATSGEDTVDTMIDRARYGLYPPGSSRSVSFQRPGVVRVFCNIHAAMSAVIVVLNTPYFTASRHDGTFELPSVPPGEYWLRIFHERATQATLDAAARRIVVTSEPLVLPPIPVSESGYLAIPHKNKFGHDYSGDPEDSAYPAVRK